MQRSLTLYFNTTKQMRMVFEYKLICLLLQHFNTTDFCFLISIHDGECTPHRKFTSHSTFLRYVPWYGTYGETKILGTEIQWSQPTFTTTMSNKMYFKGLLHVIITSNHWVKPSSAYCESGHHTRENIPWSHQCVYMFSYMNYKKC